MNGRGEPLSDRAVGGHEKLRPSDDGNDRSALGDSAAQPRYLRKVGDSGFQLLARIDAGVPAVPTAGQILG